MIQGSEREAEGSLDTSASPIWRRRLNIDNRERAELREVTKDVRAKFAAERKSLRDECEAIGHNWRFTDFGILMHIHWHTCSLCGRTRSVDTTSDDDR